MSKVISLPATDDNGQPYISYSQWKLWKSMKSFNLGILGQWEYIRKYFLKEQYEDIGWGAFGDKVENALMTQKWKGFDKAEIETLKTVETLDGEWQREFKIPLDCGAYVKGFIDNDNKELTHIRDFKTASERSKQQYYEDDYWQLDIYAGAVKVITGEYPKIMDVSIVERKGNPFRGEPLKVGKQTWVHSREVDPERIKYVIEDINKTAIEIAEHWEVFQKMNELVA